MNTLKTEQIREILAGAPDGATHYSHEYMIAKDNGWLWWDGSHWCFVSEKSVAWSESRVGLHSLSDLREILELRERVGELDSQRQWISVDDRMPELQGLIGNESIVCYETYNGKLRVTTAVYAQNVHAKTEKGRTPRWEKAGRIFDPKVIFWMPLPQPLMENTNERD